MRAFYIILTSVLLVSASYAHVEESKQDTLTWFEEVLELEKDGSAQLTFSIVPSQHHKTLKIPFQFDNGENFSIKSDGYSFEGGSYHSANPVRTISGNKYVIVNQVEKDEYGMGAFEDTIRITCTVTNFLDWKDALKEHHNYSVSASFVNTSENFINSMAISLIAPDGYSIHEIKNTVPPYNPRKSPTPPFVLDKVGGKYRVVLSSDLLNTGGKAEINVHIKNKKPGLLPLIIGLVLAIAYLIFYRDVLKRKE